jgi:asparagine synthase (glutamine-hydrolysing)
MCGIAGFLSRRGGFDRAASLRLLTRMTDSLVHRGPDGGGHWLDEQAGIALGHRRLSIIDLSPAGSQPMVSHDGSAVIAFNGEIYNYQHLRASIEARFGSIAWRGSSDTEVLLEAIARLGIEQALHEAVGMFSLAVWHRGTRTLELARDRMGEKPLYYGRVGTDLAFASELKAFRAMPGFGPSIDRDSLTAFLRHNYIPSPRTVYEDVRKLPPGTFVRFGDAQGTQSLPDPVPYWRLKAAAASGLGSPFAGSTHEAAEELNRLLRIAIRGQMISDVPLGAFLSGGVDSSTVVALMQAESSRPVKTFTIGFHETDYNEAVHAKAVATHLGTDHHELYVTPREAMDAIPRLPQIYDEPFSDSSQVPTFLVSQLARQAVTVSLSGDGGDELFGGYDRYKLAARLWGAIRVAPRGLRQGAAKVLMSLTGGGVGAALQGVTSLSPGMTRLAALTGRLRKAAPLMASRGPGELYRGLASHWRTPESVVVGGHEPPSIFMDEGAADARMSMTEWMMFIDALTYLPDDILTKVDRAAMSVSLETRVPLLDHRVVEFAWSLPVGMRVRPGRPKALLRDVLYRYVPRALIDRPKMGFGVPIGRWMRGPLRDWVESLIAVDRLKGDGFFRPDPIRLMWEEHLSGQRNWQYLIWDIVMFQSWLDANRHTGPGRGADV